MVKPKTRTEKGEILNKIKDDVKLQKLKISVDIIRETINGSLIIKCNNEVNNEALKKELGKIKNLNIEIDSFKLKNPRLKIVNIVEDINSEKNCRIDYSTKFS